MTSADSDGTGAPPPTGGSERDLDLAARARSGEAEAVDELLARLRCVRAVLARRNDQVGRPLDANELEDVVQETLIAVWTKLDRFEGYGSLEAWASRFATLEFLARLRRRRRLPPLLDDLGAGQVTEPEVEPKLQLLELERVYKGLEDLGPPESDVIRLKLLDGLTFEELAARLGMPVNTAKARYYRGLRKLRGRLERSSEGPQVGREA